jgi:hypothetical protein
VRRPTICVYCASNHGADPAYADAATRVGEHLAARGVDLVYGGGHVGLMGLVADGVLSGGGRVTGVITRQLVDREVAHDGVTDLLVVDDMPARKRAMFEAADAFLTLPGGVGTMEEFFEVLCWGYLGIHPRPMGLLNVSGYYDLLIEFIDRSVSEGLCNPRVRDLLSVSDDATALIDQLLPPHGGNGV